MLRISNKEPQSKALTRNPSVCQTPAPAAASTEPQGCLSSELHSPWQQHCCSDTEHKPYFCISAATLKGPGAAQAPAPPGPPKLSRGCSRPCRAPGLCSSQGSISCNAGHGKQSTSPGTPPKPEKGHKSLGMRGMGGDERQRDEAIKQNPLRCVTITANP